MAGPSLARALLKRQDGFGLALVLAFMVLAVPLVTATLGLATTLSVDSRVKTRIAKSQYSVLGGTDHALYRLLHEAGYASGLPVAVPQSYSLVLNGSTSTITILKLASAPPPPVPPNSDDSRRLQTLKTVTPTTAPPSFPTTYAYTITVENRDNQPESVTQIRDKLPPGFTYVLGSSSGVTAADPAIDGRELNWSVSGLNLTLQPGQSVALAFNATAAVAQGNYCNEAWTDPGGKKTSSGMAARIRVGMPPNELCQGEAAKVTKTVTPTVAAANTSTLYTYTISVENIGTADLDISDIQDMLPVGFTYVAGSSRGTITFMDPSITLQQGHQRLDWGFNPRVRVVGGQTKTLLFDAQAAVASGEYWNEVWVNFQEMPQTVYTWPTAVVQAMGVFKVDVTDGMSTLSSEFWIGNSSYLTNKSSLTR